MQANFAIVGVGASAGGLEAFSALLRQLPHDTGMAFVLIQHLDPTQPSLLSEALARVTGMPVCQAEQGMSVEPNHVYAIGPNCDIAIQEGQLVLSPRHSDGGKSHLPIDGFLRSLAAERGSQAIGVVLSGSASDGTEGLRAIRAEGGITFAQDPLTAKFPGMPQSAVDAGVVDCCLDIPELADALVNLSRHPYVRSREPAVRPQDASVQEAILERVRDVTGTDFSEFKASTVTRRLARRVALRRVADLPAYLLLLDAEPGEVRALQEDVLIHVTSFFRDPEMFESLATRVFPQILKHKAAGATIRVWVAGCSTGEEVYSLAIALLEFLGEAKASHPIQIFGSDVSELAVQKARAGLYSEGAVRGISDERLARYFSKTDSGYRIHKSVRDFCVLVKHDLLRDPPFSKLDLLSCRNVLIYFDQALQKRVLPTFHYCLGQPGFLVLGRSENVAGFVQLFVEVDKTNKIFARTSMLSSLRFAPRANADPATARFTERSAGISQQVGALLEKQLDRLLLARYAPAGILVKENLDVLLFRGQTGSFLQAASGQPQNNLIGMARGGLIAALRSTIAQAKQEMVVVRRSGVEVDQEGSTKLCDVVVIPFSGLPDNAEPMFVVLFEEFGDGAVEGSELARARDDGHTGSTEARRSARLQLELDATKEYLHILLEEHGRANDELGTSNEELVSGNEELQSMNEELETAKEELQSSNEELTTLNEELERRNNEVSEVNSDLLNFSLTVDIPILRLDRDRRIRRFTPKAHSILNVLSSDVGRSIDDIKLNIAVPDLSQQIARVMETTTTREAEVQDMTGRWYRMQIRSYTTTNHIVDGVILSLVDIHELKQLVAEAQDARAQAERANAAKDEFLAMLSHELRTPLSSMLLNAQRMRVAGMDGATVQRTGASLERAIDTQVKLIDDLLDVSRIEAGKLTLECRELDLGAVVRASLETMSAQIEAKQLTLAVSLSEHTSIWGDLARVQQVFANLLSNAIKFMPRAGKLTVQVDSVTGFGRLRVTDTGIGIDASFLPKVFAHFSQRDTSITREYGGLGLGLALVRRLVELQAGAVRAESAGLGRGATFTVTFPVPRGADHRDVVRASPPPGPLDRPGKAKLYRGLVDLRVLFIDDDVGTREAVMEVLKLSGARVVLAASAAEGMTKYVEFLPQVIVCDIAMPGEDGFTFMRKLRARETGVGMLTPALALTALASAEDKRRALAAGFQMHLAKPIDIDRLRDAIVELARISLEPTKLHGIDA